SPFASQQFAGRGADDINNELTQMMSRVLNGPQGGLNLEKLCIIPGKACWIVYIDALDLQVSRGLLPGILLITNQLSTVSRSLTTSGLTVTYSDGKKSTHPTNLSPVPDEKGNIFYYRPVAKNEPKANLYVTKLGQELCKELKQQNVKVFR
ncbi:16215_t:CDS:2, partial [Dentiscutata heterogama]